MGDFTQNPIVSVGDYYKERRFRISDERDCRAPRESKSESQYGPPEDFTLRTYRAADVNDASRAANESHIRVHQERQPFGLNLEAEMATGIEPDPASDSKRETREVDVCTAGNVCGTNAGQHEWPGPRDPVFDQELVAEVSMK